MISLFQLIVFLLFSVAKTHGTIDFHYHNYSQLTTILQDFAARFPSKASLIEIGKSYRGKSLWAIALSDSLPDQHVLLRPEVKYIGNMHGNEVVGLEVLLHLIEHLLTSNDDQVKTLMNNSRIWIMPSMNPDGLEISQYGDCNSVNGRLNANNIDLNRNFPDYYGAQLDSPTQAVETTAVRTWLQSTHFVLSANYHGGAFVINTPLDRYYFGRNSISHDDDIYQSLARQYVNRALEGNEFCFNEFQGSGFVVRGADWYEIIGGMQDYGYFNYGTIELTMEISCCKYPISNLLLGYWNYNRPAMIELLLQAQRGVKGLILDENLRPIPSTQVMIDNRRPLVKVTSLGEFWKILMPGNYTLQVLYNSTVVHTQKIHIEDQVRALNLTIIIPSLNFELSTNSSTPGLFNNAKNPFVLYSFFLLLIFQ